MPRPVKNGFCGKGLRNSEHRQFPALDLFAIRPHVVRIRPGQRFRRGTFFPPTRRGCAGRSCADVSRKTPSGNVKVLVGNEIGRIPVPAKRKQNVAEIDPYRRHVEQKKRNQNKGELLVVRKTEKKDRQIKTTPDNADRKQRVENRFEDKRFFVRFPLPNDGFPVSDLRN